MIATAGRASGAVQVSITSTSRLPAWERRKREFMLRPFRMANSDRKKAFSLATESSGRPQEDVVERIIPSVRVAASTTARETEVQSNSQRENWVALRDTCSRR